MIASEKRVLVVGTFLSHAGHNPSYCEALASRLESLGWLVTRTSHRTGRATRLVDMLSTIWMRRNDYSVAIVDVFSGAAFVWAEAVCLTLGRLGKPYLLALRGGALPEFARRWPLRTRSLLRSARMVTAPSEYMRECMRPYHARIELLPNALDTSAYRFVPRSHPRPRLVWVRAFHKTYNPALAIDVLAHLSGRFSDASLTMIGPDKSDGSYQTVVRRIRELCLGDRVTIAGRLDKAEIARRFEAADILINTTDVDNTPISVLEAMVAGLCIVSTNVGGLPFLLRQDDTALLVPPRDAGAMSAAVERVLTEPGVADVLSRKGHAFAVKYDWMRILQQWELALEQLAR